MWSFVWRDKEDYIADWTKLQSEQTAREDTVIFSSCISLNLIQLGKHSPKLCVSLQVLTSDWCSRCMGVVGFFVRFWLVEMLGARVQCCAGPQYLSKDTVISKITWTPLQNQSWVTAAL